MIVYEPLWKTMKEKKVSQYLLIKTYGISCGQLDRLKKIGCEYVQGYLMGRPMPRQQLEELLEEQIEKQVWE